MLELQLFDALLVAVVGPFLRNFAVFCCWLVLCLLLQFCLECQRLENATSLSTVRPAYITFSCLRLLSGSWQRNHHPFRVFECCVWFGILLTLAFCSVLAADVILAIVCISSVSVPETCCLPCLLQLEAFTFS